MKINLYTPWWFQRDVHNACNDDTTFFITAICGRQIGKTLLAINQCFLWALRNSHKKIFWVSPTAAQVQKVYKQMYKPLLSTGLMKSHKGTQGDTEIVLFNDSVIQFRSAASGDNLRGDSVNYMILDEAAFIKEEIFEEILLPMLNVAGEKCLVISTPKGRNWVYYHYLRGFQDSLYKSFRVRSYDNPYANKVLIENARKKSNEIYFKQEYEGEFVDNAAIFENVLELAKLEQKKPYKGKFFIGIDIALKYDWTVLTILNENKEMVAIYRWQKITATELQDNIVDVLNNWKPVSTFIESNNQGQPIIDNIKLKYKSIEGFNTSASSKADIINNLIWHFSNKAIKIINNEFLINELSAFEMQIGDGGKVKFGAPSGFHDDCVMSLAIALECYNKKAKVGNYVTIGF